MLNPSQKCNIEIGKRYSREEITRMLGGSTQVFAPYRDGRTTCICLDPKKNPGAPRVILLEQGPLRQEMARLIAESNQPLPVFLKIRNLQWEYCGNYRFKSQSTSASAIQKAHNGSSSPIDTIAAVIYMKKASSASATLTNKCKKEPVTLSNQQRLWAIREIRKGRSIALQHAEDWNPLMNSIENITKITCKPKDPLSKRLSCFIKYLTSSQQVDDQLKTYLHSLQKTIIQDRNLAVHEGVKARKFVGLLVKFTKEIEDILLIDMRKTIETYMVEDIKTAELWHPLRFLRQQMLNSSFSWIPVKNNNKWYLISDHAVAKLKIQDHEKLDQNIEDLWKHLTPQPAHTTTKCEEISNLNTDPKNGPTLVLDTESNLIGLITAFDLL